MKNETVEEVITTWKVTKKHIVERNMVSKNFWCIKYRIKLLNFVKYAIIHFRLFKNNLNGGEVMNIQEFMTVLMKVMKM